MGRRAVVARCWYSVHMKTRRAAPERTWVARPDVGAARARTWAALAPVIAALAAAPVALSACDHGRREARSLIAAVDRYRRAPTEQAPELADALATVPCTEEDVCAAKEVCVRSASATARGVRKRREVESKLADVQAGRLAKDDPRAVAAYGELDESVQAMTEGMEAMQACHEKITALRVKSR